MEIYGLLRSLAEQGIPTLVLLTEYEEVLQLPDRLLVMYEGKIVNECQGDTVQEEQLLSSYFCN
jgi:ribose transport system ATP-binding protein